MDLRKGALASLQPSDDQVRAYAKRIYCVVRAEVPAYAAISDSEVDRDFADVNRRNVELYFRVMNEERAPHPDELAELEIAAQRRLHQAVPLEAIFHSYRLGARVLWECLLEHVNGDNLGRLAALTFDYADRVSSAAARAYLEERERVSHSHHEASRLFFTRLFSGDFDDEPTVLREAHALGYDLSHVHIVVLVVPSLRRDKASAEDDLALAEAQSQLERFFIEGPALLMRAGSLFAVPSGSAQNVATSVHAALMGLPQANHRFVIGIGTPRAGPHGLVESFHEAQRASTLGAILKPTDLIHRYDELRFFDLFKQGEPIEAFVQEVLGQLIAYDLQHNSSLAETLNEVFGTALNRKVAAHRLGIHPNTMSYRIRQIEELLSGSLLSGEFCFRVQLALKLLPLTHLINGERR